MPSVRIDWFADVREERIETTWTTDRPEGLLDLVYGGAVRVAIVLEAQEPARRARIHDAIFSAAKLALAATRSSLEGLWSWPRAPNARVDDVRFGPEADISASRPVTLFGLHSLRSHDGDGFWSAQKSDQVLSRLPSLGIGTHACGKDNEGLQLNWERSDELNAGRREDLTCVRPFRAQHRPWRPVLKQYRRQVA